MNQRKKTENNRKAKKRIFIESAIAFFIVLAPFLHKVYEFFPETATTTIMGFEINSGTWPDVQAYTWFVFIKIVPLYLIFIWFMTCKHWWYHILLIPLIMYTFQLFEAVFDQDNNVDSANLMWILPICIGIIPFVYFIRLKLYDKHVHGIDLDAMNEELNILKAKEELRKEREKLEQRKETLEKKM